MVITLDMIANIKDGHGYVDSTRVRVFSEDPNDSLSRELARYVRRTTQAVLPHFEVELIFRPDRFGRGGDHTPFVLEGFPGIRFTEARENYSVQHTPMDIIDNLSVPYCADVTRIILASVLSLACAPQAPEVISERGVPLLRRGQGYDAELSWIWNGNKQEISGFKIYVRDTKAPFWEKSYFAGKGESFTLKNVSIDNLTFGVSAIGANGLESLISIYRIPGRSRAEYVYRELK